MSLSTSNSKTVSTDSTSEIRSIYRAISIGLLLLLGYHVLVKQRVVPATSGINQAQSNVIKAQKYVYENPSPKLILVGSSLTATIKPKDIGSHVINLGMAGGSSQTGLEIVKKEKLKSAILLVEINETIERKLDQQLLDSIYEPVSHFSQLHFPMLRQEYKPVDVLVQAVKNRLKSAKKEEKNEPPAQAENFNPKLREKVLAQQISAKMQPLSQSERQTLKSAAKSIKTQIAELQKQGLRIILYDLPGEKQVKNTIEEKQIQQIMREEFPADTYEWLPAPAFKNWVTSDGSHLVSSDAQAYAVFLRDKLLKTPFSVSRNPGTTQLE
ncbi:hypothetical protein [Microcoleus sp. FACHB-672]|uniref:hypothetical protein n=1 Tax=Microcoleus sp. FACHB-672 TaxID=2692825 RepID=UPI0016868DAB|nr:hypothetical protein [Microcoleus sp. FACHB-672]MBD2043956.1 hypothetical protein [Microcoleus sp. FACHB-672]